MSMEELRAGERGGGACERTMCCCWCGASGGARACACWRAAVDAAAAASWCCKAGGKYVVRSGKGQGSHSPSLFVAALPELVPRGATL